MFGPLEFEPNLVLGSIQFQSLHLQIIKNSQTKCVKDEWFRSSLVFDTISLKQISLLTQFMVLWDSRTSAPKIKWSTTRRRSTQGPYSMNYSMSLSLSLTQMNAQKKFLSRRVIKKKKKKNHEWGTMYIYITKQTHCFRNNCCIQNYWLKK